MPDPLETSIGVARTVTFGTHRIQGVMAPILRQGTELPAEATRRFTTSDELQTTIVFSFFRGEAPLASENERLGAPIKVSVPPALAGHQSIDLTVRADERGRITIDASVVSLGEKVLQDFALDE